MDNVLALPTDNEIDTLGSIGVRDYLAALSFAADNVCRLRGQRIARVPFLIARAADLSGARLSPSDDAEVFVNRVLGTRGLAYAIGIGVAALQVEADIAATDAEAARLASAEGALRHAGQVWAKR
jgi:hypothetical protein